MNPLRHGVLALALFAGALLVPAAVSAQPEQVPVVEHDFADADRVEGTLRGPETEAIHGSRRRPRRSLIVPRLAFVRELVETADHR